MISWNYQFRPVLNYLHLQDWTVKKFTYIKINYLSRVYIIKDNRKCIEHLSYILIYCVAIFDNITQVLLLFPNYELGNQSSESCSLFAAELGFRVQVPQTPACAPNQSFCELNRQPLRTKMKIRSCLFSPTQCLSRKQQLDAD